MEAPIQRELNGVIVAVERRNARDAARVGEGAGGRRRGRPSKERELLIVGGTPHTIRPDVGEYKRNRIGIYARQIDFGPPVAGVLVDVRRARRQVRRDLLLEVGGRLLPVGVLE